MRFGLAGTGPWAQMAHGPGLKTCPDVDLVGVWGRDSERTVGVARALDTRAYRTYEELLADVDAVAFAVPPDVQSDLALAAARAGKHLLLDKPVASNATAARAVRDAAAYAGVASVVFFTDRFIDRHRAWLIELGRTGGWSGGSAVWFSAAPQGDRASDSSAWRQRYGALWNTGPHAFAAMVAALGPVDSIAAVPGAGDLVVVVLRHESGASSTVTLSSSVPARAARYEVSVWGEAGVSVMPARPDVPWGDVLAVAACELVVSAANGTPHPVDVNFGTGIVELLAEAQHQLDRTARDGA